MFSVATQEAIDAVDLSDNNSKVMFTKFQMGDLVATLPNLDTIANFDFSTFNTQEFLSENLNLKYEGDEDQIKYNVVALDRVVLKCYAPPEIADTFKFDCVMLYAELDGEEFIFSWHYYQVLNPKFNIEQTEGGMRYYFLLTLDLANIAESFDFSNLVQEEVTFLDAEDWFGLPPAHKELKDQAILHKHFNTPNSTPHLVINTQEQWYGTPMSTVILDGIDRDLLLPMVGNFFPIVDQTIPEGYMAYLKEDGSFHLDHQGNELMIEVPYNGADTLEYEGDILEYQGTTIVVPRPAPALTYQVDSNNYPLRDEDGNLIPV